tara:strand:- start:3973 stop:4605 length:633 start_codon:yes stop_codon:yes gene_type:complete
MVLFEINKLDSNVYSVPIHNPMFNDFLSLFHIDFKKNDHSININCSSISYLNEFLFEFQDNLITYDYAYAFSQNIVKQILYLEKQKKTITALSLDDFIIIDKSFLLFVNFKKIVDIQNNNITILSPYNKNNNTFFITKMMKENSNLPLTIHYKNIYLSLAYLILYCLYGKHYFDYNDNNKLISNLLGTKLYYFIQNCLTESEENRHICFF